MAEVKLEDEEVTVGMRVMAVDSDGTSLKMLEALLRHCGYDVTATGHASTALSLLRESRGSYDLLIASVYMPDMDGFELLDHVVAEMDIPVVLISATSERRIVRKAIIHGASYFLVKPVRVEVIRNIWQHAFRHKKFGGIETGGKPEPQGKHKRLNWTDEMHNKFIEAIALLGNEAVPSKILHLMDVPDITRHQVASRLQKYRTYLRRIKTDHHRQYHDSFGALEAFQYINYPWEASNRTGDGHAGMVSSAQVHNLPSTRSRQSNPPISESPSPFQEGN